MYRHLLACALAVVVLVAAPAASHGAAIVYGGVDTTTQLNWNGVYGSARAQVWDLSSGSPDYTSPLAVNTNPNYVGSFTWQNSGGGGGSGNGSGGGGGTTGIRYDLVLNANKSFQFTTLFYDANYDTRNPGLVGTDVVLKARLIDPSAAAASWDVWHDITLAQLKAGIYLKWNVVATAGETITTDVVWANGTDGVGAAGFFMDNVVTVPEPATMGLLALGLGGILIRRKRK